ncbi:MAG TPA: hypothetical protein PLU22_03150 [Polyangiaceae bacterium]|nr:hypothetical protein [Polyangiaceae bacterium]
MEGPLRHRGRVWRRLGSLSRRLLWIASRAMLGACAALGPVPPPPPPPPPPPIEERDDDGEERPRE